MPFSTPIADANTSPTAAENEPVDLGLVLEFHAVWTATEKDGAVTTARLQTLSGCQMLALGGGMLSVVKYRPSRSVLSTRPRLFSCVWLKILS